MFPRKRLNLSMRVISVNSVDRRRHADSQKCSMVSLPATVVTGVSSDERHLPGHFLAKPTGDRIYFCGLSASDLAARKTLSAFRGERQHPPVTVDRHRRAQ